MTSVQEAIDWNRKQAEIHTRAADRYMKRADQLEELRNRPENQEADHATASD